MASKQDTGTGTSEQSAPKTEATESTGGFASELMKVAQEMGIEVGDSPVSSEKEHEQDEEQTETAVQEPKNEEEQQEQEEPPTISEGADTDGDSRAEEETESEEETKPAAKQTDPEKLHARIVDETRKRKQRTQERDDYKAELDEVRAERDAYRQQLAVAQRPRPTVSDPLADVHDEASLQAAEAQIEEVLEFAESHPDGAQDVVMGKDANGKDILQDFTREQIAQIKINAGRRLRKEIPQRRALLVQRAQMDAEAVKSYPDFKDPDSELSQEAGQWLRQFPEIMRFPDALMCIGDFIEGRKIRLSKANGQKNGKNGDATVKRIVESSKTKLAPTATKSRAFESTRRGADLTKLEKRLEERGDTESAEAYVGAILSKRRSGKAQLVNQ